MKEEPSVLDYVKAKLSFGRIRLPEPPRLKPQPDTALMEVEPEIAAASTPVAATFRLPWRTLMAFFLALIAQVMLEPPARSVELAAILYILAAGWFVWATLKGEWGLPPLREDAAEPMAMDARQRYFWFLLPLMIAAFYFFSGNRFTSLNLFLWVVTLLLTFYAMWIPASRRQGRSLFGRLSTYLNSTDMSIRITPWMITLFLAALLVVFFRFYMLDRVPGEMFSDHAEKLLDVSDVLNGQTSIFFVRNTGREAVQMYLTAAIASWFGTGLSFISLKLGTALAGILALPFIYLLGKEVGNRWVGLLAFVLAGMAYWPNVISRVGLRFPLYALFVAPMLYFLIRGLRTSNRNDFLLAGLALGIGLHGYSPMRIVPFIVLIAVGIYMLHGQSRGKRKEVFWGLVALAFVAFIVFLPLFRYMLEDPEMFGSRAFSRLSTTERSFPAPVWLIFFQNTWKSMIMFFYDNGGIWVHSIPGRPALDVITAVLFFAGTVALVVRYLRQRHWLDLLLLLLVPLLMMPSILSLAFPEENPSLNRSSAAIVPVFIIAALGLEGLLSALARRTTTRKGKATVLLIGLLIITLAANANYKLIFEKYNQQFMGGAWNTSQIGHTIREFSETFGSPDTAFVVPYPHWVDTRLVGINAGYPLKDYALWRDSIPNTLSEPRAKLFIVKPDDVETRAVLDELYPQGVWQLKQENRYEGKNFLIFMVPQQQDDGP
jgi:4-amino-4-deoxy-L-arabinose transferase-like glycosyltransferase